MDKPKRPRKAQPPTVKVLVDGVIHDGLGGRFSAGQVIVVTAEQAASLKAKGFAE